MTVVALAVALAAGLLALRPPLATAALNDPAYKGWGRVTVPTATAHAWRWDGVKWNYAARTNSEQVYLWPFTAGWTWTWTQTTGWSAMRSTDVTADVIDNNPFFVGDFETGALGQWPDLTRVPPDGREIVGTPTAHADSKHAWRVNTGTTHANFASTGFDREYERPGRSTWYRFRVAFPSGNSPAFPGSFTPQNWNYPDGKPGWNTLVQWREPGMRYVGSLLRPGFTDSPTLGLDRYGRFTVRWVGGPAFGGTNLVWTDDRVIGYDRWYDVYVHVLWDHTGRDGYVEMWLDGRKVLPAANWPARFATLWQYGDGVYAPAQMQFGHSRRNPAGVRAAYTDTLYLDSFRAGPTVASVTSNL